MQIEISNFDNFSQLVAETYDVLLPLIWDGVKDNKLVRVNIMDLRDEDGVSITLRWRNQPTQEEIDTVSQAFSVNMPDYKCTSELLPYRGIMLPTSFVYLTKATVNAEEKPTISIQ